MTPRGSLYLIPTTLGEQDPMTVLPESVRRTILHLNHFIVENEKTARRFIKVIAPEKPQPSLVLSTLNKRTDPAEHREMLAPCMNGVDVGLMSEAGCPGIADPGADIVRVAHASGIRVIPMVGPSSILLAMMASGMNGQRFAFNGYLPIDKSDKKQALRQWEKISSERNQSQAFIETPYRNNKLMEELLQALMPGTLLCVAADITLPTEFIKTQAVADWKKAKVDLDKRPCIFIIHGEPVSPKKSR